MTKTELEKALARFLAAEPEIRYNLHSSLRSILAAARRFADLLPEECETCGGSGEVTVHCGSEYCGGCDDPNCVQLDVHPCFDGCGGSGKVWNPEVVERIYATLVEVDALSEVPSATLIDMSRAVLAVLTEEEKP